MSDPSTTADSGCSSMSAAVVGTGTSGLEMLSSTQDSACPQTARAIIHPQPSQPRSKSSPPRPNPATAVITPAAIVPISTGRSEEHTSELQSRFDLVCRLLLEQK